MGRNNLSIMKVIYKPQRIAIRHKSNVSVPGTSQAPASAFGRSSNSGNTNEKLKSPIYHSFNKRRFKVLISEKEKVKKNVLEVQIQTGITTKAPTFQTVSRKSLRTNAGRWMITAIPLLHSDPEHSRG